jgi:hypothetical protein
MAESRRKSRVSQVQVLRSLGLDPGCALEAKMNRSIALPLLTTLMIASGCDRPTQPASEQADLVPGLNDKASETELEHSSVVYVAPPTGHAAADVESILAAVAVAEPGSTIQFAQGRYVLDSARQIVVSVPGVTLRGHSAGTTIRGVFGFNSELSGNFLMNGGRQTVRGLTFERFSLAVSFGEIAPVERTGGYRLEDCTFRNGDIAISFVGFSNDVSVIRNNRFINTGIPLATAGKTIHFRHNTVRVPDPTAVPLGSPDFVALILPEYLSGINVCENNRFEWNRVVGNADGFVFLVEPGQVCRNNLIRGNTFIGQRIFKPADGGSITAAVGGGRFKGNLIADNVLRGSEGVGLYLLDGTDNRILRNQFSDLPGLKEPAPGFPGTAIILGEATSRNVLANNQFRNVQQEVVDLGTGNIIREATRAAQAALSTRPAPDASEIVVRYRQKLERFRSGESH